MNQKKRRKNINDFIKSVENISSWEEDVDVQSVQGLRVFNCGWRSEDPTGNQSSLLLDLEGKIKCGKKGKGYKYEILFSLKNMDA